MRCAIIPSGGKIRDIVRKCEMLTANPVNNQLIKLSKGKKTQARTNPTNTTDQHHQKNTKHNNNFSYFSQSANFSSVAEDGRALREHHAVHSQSRELLERKLCTLKARQAAHTPRTARNARERKNRGQNAAELRERRRKEETTK